MIPDDQRWCSAWKRHSRHAAEADIALVYGLGFLPSAAACSAIWTLSVWIATWPWPISMLTLGPLYRVGGPSLREMAAGANTLLTVERRIHSRKTWSLSTDIRISMGRSKAAAFGGNVLQKNLSARLIESILLQQPQPRPERDRGYLLGLRAANAAEQGFNIAATPHCWPAFPSRRGGHRPTACAAHSMQALHDASRAAIQVGDGDIFIMLAASSMGAVPMSHGVDCTPAWPESVAKPPA